MKQNSLADCLFQLRGKLQLEGNSHSTLLILDQIGSRLASSLQMQQDLEKSLSVKLAQLKQTARKLKKTNNKLNRKTQECQALQEQLTRVNGIYSHKVQRLASQAESFKERGEWEQPELKINLKKSKSCSLGFQCEILKQTSIEELSAQNQMLKLRLQETQRMLIAEKKQRGMLSCELQRLKTAGWLQNQLIKDNSTDDAGSHRGDPFDQDQAQFEEADKEQQEKPFRKQENLLTRIWGYGQALYRKLTLKK